MNANVGLAVLLVGFLLVGGATVTASDSAPPPLVDDLHADPAGEECRVTASIDTTRLDAGERIVIETGEAPFGADYYPASGPGARFVTDAARGANVTIYVADTLGGDGVDVLERARLTSDCRLVARAAP